MGGNFRSSTSSRLTNNHSHISRLNPLSSISSASRSRRNRGANQQAESDSAAAASASAGGGGSQSIVTETPSPSSRGQGLITAGATGGGGGNTTLQMSNSTNTNSNTLLNQPYGINNRVATDDTQLLRVPSISRNGGVAGVLDNDNLGAVTPPNLTLGTAGTGRNADPTSSAVGVGPSNNTNNTQQMTQSNTPGGAGGTDGNSNQHPSVTKSTGMQSVQLPVHCLNPASEINGRLDTQVEVRVYPCNNNSQTGSAKKKFTQFNVKPEGVIIQGTNRHRAANNDLGAEYAMHVGRKLQRYELSDTRACQLLVTTHNKSFWVVPAPEAFSRHSGTCRLLGDRKHQPASHTLQVGDFLRVGSVGVVVIETHDGVENRILSEEKIQKIMKDTTNSAGGFLDLAETDGENSDDSSQEGHTHPKVDANAPVCYMCFDEEDTEENPMITPCKCLGDTRYVHVNCLRKWHTAEADNQICFLSSVDATCSVCKSTFRSDFKLKDGRVVKLFKSSLEPPYVSLLVATKHEMAQRLFNTRFQLSFSTLLKPDGRNGTRPLLLGRSSGSDMVLDYRTVSARHATIRFKNGEFIFTDAGSSNGSYLYLRRPVELTPSQSVQFRLGRSMISMKVVNKWNRRLLRAVSRRVGVTGSSNGGNAGEGDDHSVGSNDDDVRITDSNGSVTRTVTRRTREQIMGSMPPMGGLSQSSPQHLDLLYALAYPKRMPTEKDIPKRIKSGPENSALPPPMEHVSEGEDDESKVEDDTEVQVVEQSEVRDIADDLKDMALVEEEEEIEEPKTTPAGNDAIGSVTDNFDIPMSEKASQNAAASSEG